MINSMTAFARVDLPTEWGAVQWELRSVNHRHLDTQFRLPEQFRELEFPLRDTLRKQLRRGKIDARLTISSEEAAHMEINRPMLLQLLATVEQLRRDAPETSHPNPLELLRWPGVLTESRANPTPYAQSLSSLSTMRSPNCWRIALVRAPIWRT